MVTEISVFTNVQLNKTLIVDPNSRAVFHHISKQAQLPCEVDEDGCDSIAFNDNEAFYWEAKEHCKFTPISTHISFHVKWKERFFILHENHLT